MSIFSLYHLKAGVPELVFQGIYYSGIGHKWDLAPDGKRFLMMKEFPDDASTEETARPKINIVLNWLEELKQRVPVD